MSGAPDHVFTKPSPIHGNGAFAAKAFTSGEKVVEYLGERITKEESLRRCESGNDFIFYLSDTWNLDGNVTWNPARHLNHSCEPNCDAELIDGQIWIVARRDIPTGAELTFNYSYDLSDYREHPCQCGSAKCAGYIVAEEFLEVVRGR